MGIDLLEEKGTFVASAVLYFVSGAAILLVPIKFREVIVSKKNAHPLGDLGVGFEFIRRNQIVRYSLLKLFVATSAIAAISLLAISYAGKVLMIGERNFGYLIIAVGVGMLVGMGTLERLRHYLKFGTIVVISFLASGITLLWLSNTSNLHLALFLIMILGLSNIYITSSLQTILQSKIPRQIRGRVFGVQNMLINSAFTLPVVIFGIVADIWGILFAIAVLGWVVLLTGVAGIFLPKFKTA
jgi:predicted MFS family arabinose efflux permease